MYQAVELFTEPLSVLGKDAYCEMTPSEQGFLCGLIRKYNPQKIVEIGVAGGGNTAVIMKCLDMLGSDAKMFSVDISEECYRRPGKTSGYQLEEVKNQLNNFHNHRFLLGKILPEVIEKIGSDIDFVILDTVHDAPGELLDFLCIIPFLKNGSVIALHDTAVNLNRCTNAYINKIILNSAVGTKYYNYTDEILNIGAVEINEETRKNIANVFSAFSITWRYPPSELEIECYRRIYSKFYDEECMSLFEMYVTAQIDSMKKEMLSIVEADRLSSVYYLSDIESDVDKLYRHFTTFDDEVVYVLDENGLIDGIVSAGDMYRYYEKKEKRFKINKCFKSIPSAVDYTYEARKILNQLNTIHEVPIINNGRLIGIIKNGRKKEQREWDEFRKKLEEKRIEFYNSSLQ